MDWVARPHNLVFQTISLSNVKKILCQTISLSNVKKILCCIYIVKRNV